MTLMILDSLHEAWRPAGNAFTFTVPPGWMQGRSLFGGLTVASAVALARRVSPRQLRSLHAQLLGPVVAGEVSATCHVLREGKTTTFVEVRLSQDNSERAVISLVLIDERAGSRAIEGPAAPTWRPPSTTMPEPFLGGMAPEFVQNLDFRFEEGSPPFQGGERAHLGGYIRFRDEVSRFTSEHQIALLDAWPCPTLSVLERPVFASTVAWTAHLVSPSAPGFHSFTYDTVAAAGGFSTSVGHLWDSAGTYVGFSEQTIVVFD